MGQGFQTVSFLPERSPSEKISFLPEFVKTFCMKHFLLVSRS